MKIGLCGTMSVGKTTLVNELKKLDRFSRFEFATERSEYLKGLGIPLNTDSTLKGQTVFLAERVTELMKQNQYSPLSVAEMALSLFAANEGYFDDVEIKKVMAFEKALHEYARANHNDLLEKINNSPDYNDEIGKSMKALMDDFKTNGVW